MIKKETGTTTTLAFSCKFSLIIKVQKKRNLTRSIFPGENYGTRDGDDPLPKNFTENISGFEDFENSDLQLLLKKFKLFSEYKSIS